MNYQSTYIQIKDSSHHHHFAMVYNQAVETMTELISFREGKEIKAGSTKADWEHIIDIIKEKLVNGEAKKDFKPQTYLFLKDYLWNGLNTGEMNTILTKNDEYLICEILYVLNTLRNYVSHWFHEYAALQVSEHLKEFLTGLFVIAKEKTEYKYKTSRNWNERIEELPDINFTLFDEKSGRRTRYYFNLNGLVFFASLFVPASVINEHFSYVRGFKGNDKPEFEFKRDLYRYYAKPDGSSRLAFLYNQELLIRRETADLKIIQEVYRQCTMYDIIGTLKKAPGHMVDARLIKALELEDINEEDEVVNVKRHGTPFLKFAVKFLMDFNEELGWQDVQWRVVARLKNAKDISAEENKAARESPGFPDSKKFRITQFSYSNSFTPSQRTYVNDGQVFAKIAIDEKEQSVIFHQRSLKNVIAAIAGDFREWHDGKNKSEKILTEIKEYVKEYQRLLAAIRENKVPVDPNSYNCLQFRHLPGKLADLALSKAGVSADNLKEYYFQKINQRLCSITEKLVKLDNYSVTKLSKFQKNRYLQQWYNSLLNTADKLKASKNRQQSYSEINRLSIFHYTLDSRQQPFIELIRDILDKFPSVLRTLLTTLITPNSIDSPTPLLDGLLLKVKQLMEDYWLAVLKCLNEYKIPQHWENPAFWKVEIEFPFGKPETVSLDILEKLAMRLRINNPSLDKKRSTLGKQSDSINRRYELIRFFEQRPVYIPASYISNLLINDPGFDRRIDDNTVVEYENGKESKIHYRESVSKAIRKNKSLTARLKGELYLNDESGKDPRIDTIQVPQGADRKKFIKELIRQSNEQKTLDALLLFIADYYHRNIFKQPLGNIETFTTSPIVKKMDGYNILIPYYKVSQLNYYNNEQNIRNTLSLYFKGKENISYEEIEGKIRENKKLAREYAKNVLQLDKYLYYQSLKSAAKEGESVKASSYITDDLPYKEKYHYKNFLDLCKQGGLSNHSKIVQWRNRAFHNRIPDPSLGGFEEAMRHIKKLMQDIGCMQARKNVYRG